MTLVERPDMTLVRRCDNPACTLGANGSANVSESANPDGWLTGSATLIVGAATVGAQDFCSAQCAIAGLTGQVKAAAA